MALTTEDLVDNSHFISPAGLARQVDRKHKNPDHLALLDHMIVETVLEDDGRLIVSMPPRHGKSERVSKFTPAWYLMLNPEKRVILASYEQHFAALWGGAVRDIINEHGPMLAGIRVSQDTSAKGEWSLEKWDEQEQRWLKTGGGMLAVGVGGAVTGRGGDLLIIDDPIKNNKDAASRIKRESVWTWWQSTFSTRTEPGASIIIIMTRWNEDDLVGRLLKEAEEDEYADQWKELKLPAIAEKDERINYGFKKCWTRKKGSPLWPQRWPHVLTKKRTSGTYFWEALYQQNPQPEELMGDIKREWFEYVDLEDFKAGVITTSDGERLKFKLRASVRYWDLAATKPKNPADDPDWTVGALMHRIDLYVDDDQIEPAFIIEDLDRFREDPGKTEKRVVARSKADGRRVPVRMEQEPGASGKTLVASFKRRFGALGFGFKGKPSTGSKELRAAPFAAAVEDRRVYLMSGGRWIEDFLFEAVRFPRGEHDDQVDACSGAYEHLFSSFVPLAGARTIDRSSPWFKQQ